MNKEEFTGEEMLEEMTKLNPERLNENTMKLFYTIMEVIDERDNLRKEKQEYIKWLEDKYTNGYEKLYVEDILYEIKGDNDE